MAGSGVLLAKRAFVKVLLALATVCEVALKVTRDSSDAELTRAFRLVSLRAHPNKGGTTEHAQQLNAVKAAWAEARTKLNWRGWPPEGQE